MNKLLSTALLTIVTFVAFAQPQSYEEVAKKCASEFREGLLDMLAGSNEQALLEKDSVSRQCLMGLKFPDFELTSVDGKRYQLSDLKGKVVMSNFWFIGCAPCFAEMPILNELVAEYGDHDFVLLTFSTDDKEAILNLTRKRKLNYAIFEKSRPLIENTFHLSFGYPTNILLDKKGNKAEFKTGGTFDNKHLRTAKLKFKEVIDTELKR